MADISQINLPNDNNSPYNIKDASVPHSSLPAEVGGTDLSLVTTDEKATWNSGSSDTKVTQTEIASVASGQPKYEVLFSETNDDYTTKTEGAKKTSNLTYNNRLKMLSVNGASVPKMYSYELFYAETGLVSLPYKVGEIIDDYNGFFDDRIRIIDVMEIYVVLSSPVVVSSNGTSNLYDITNFSSKKIIPMDFWAYRLNAENFNSYWSWIGCQCEGKWIKAINARNTQAQIDAFRIQYYETIYDI